MLLTGVSGELLQTLPIVRYSIAPEVANGSVAAPKCAVCYMEFEEGDEQVGESFYSDAPFALLVVCLNAVAPSASRVARHNALSE